LKAIKEFAFGNRMNHARTL